jgi:DNA-binding protein HU-beta
LTKQEFIDAMASKSGLARRDAEKAVDAFLDTVKDALRSGQDVSFTGFGKFSTQQRAERQGVNPRNPSERVTIPAARVPRFSAGSQLKQAVRG